MNGVINILKPPGMTSHDVVAFLRRQFKIRKVGHTGTLDPQAAGVLPVCIGQATRLAGYLSANDKEYLCRMTLGISTSTQDAWGEISERRDKFEICREQVEQALNGFRGEIEQKVPEFSAVKISGVPMYKKARKGEKVTALTRKIEVYGLDLLEYRDKEVALHIHCSKGTYVRTLCHDLGRTLGVGAHMSFLVRLRAGSFKLEDSCTLEEVMDKKEALLIPMSKCIDEIPKIILDDASLKLIRYGRVVDLPIENKDWSAPKSRIQDDTIGLLDKNNNLHALALPIKIEGQLKLKPKIVFNLEQYHANNQI